jgi:hypothetical protein
MTGESSGKKIKKNHLFGMKLHGDFAIDSMGERW